MPYMSDGHRDYHKEWIHYESKPRQLEKDKARERYYYRKEVEHEEHHPPRPYHTHLPSFSAEWWRKHGDRYSYRGPDPQKTPKGTVVYAGGRYVPEIDKITIFPKHIREKFKEWRDKSWEEEYEKMQRQSGRSGKMERIDPRLLKSFEGHEGPYHYRRGGMPPPRKSTRTTRRTPRVTPTRRRAVEDDEADEETMHERLHEEYGGVSAAQLRAQYEIAREEHEEEQRRRNRRTVRFD